jgi:alpha-beta hydrolase superfamily lysophospholipase
MTQLRLDSGVTLPGENRLCMTVEVHQPAPGVARPVALVCLPGGGMNRHYFDLSAKDGAADANSFSFVHQMTARGFIVVTMDYLGVGDSDRPADGHALTPDLLVQANAKVLAQVLESLRKDVPDLVTIGVGHSMGAMMTILQQARDGTHVAIALLGFSTRGMPEYLSGEARALAAEGHEVVRARLVELARKTFVEPYPVIRTGASTSMFAGSKADPRAASIIKPAADVMLPVPAFMSMLPGNVAPEAAQIKVPVYLGLGELDIAGPVEHIPDSFPASPEVGLHIWPATGHSHFLFPGRAEVFAQVADWAGSVTNK